jgi:chemotaxis signal transduction protein
MMGRKYNATVILKQNGKVMGFAVAYVDENGKILRSNVAQVPGLEGKPQYDSYIRKEWGGYEIEIRKDNGALYERVIRHCAIPPTYWP